MYTKPAGLRIHIVPKGLPFGNPEGFAFQGADSSLNGRGNSFLTINSDRDVAVGPRAHTGCQSDDMID